MQNRFTEDFKSAIYASVEYIWCLKSIFSPAGTAENSPAIHCRETGNGITPPAINCRAIFRSPSGTKKPPEPAF
ncbi:MAG: hypothetical protein BWK80_48985 [Desulfobacteraceae bacterium IS3]|nr:MAG: hypothetical protein BWK80_48985 [Desulfobacteraceae bacterium IS3]